MRILIFIILFVTPWISQGQTPLLKNYSFNGGQYRLIGISNERWPNDIQGKLGSFYIEDIPLLEKVRETWTVKTKKVIYGHKEDQFYHYVFIVLKHNKIVGSFNVNLDSSVIVTDSGSYSFDTNNIRALIGKVRPIVQKEHYFTTYTKGKAFQAEVSKDKSYLFATEWNWENYEGSFNINYKNFDDANEVIKNLKNYIVKNHPNEAFKVDIVMIYSNKELKLKITCNKGLYDRIKLQKYSWTPLNFHLTSYWKK